MEVTITTENFESYKNGVRNIPTILFFKGGQLVDKYVGSASKATLTEKFQALL